MGVGGIYLSPDLKELGQPCPQGTFRVLGLCSPNKSCPPQPGPGLLGCRAQHPVHCGETSSPQVGSKTRWSAAWKRPKFSEEKHQSGIAQASKCPRRPHSYQASLTKCAKESQHSDPVRFTTENSRETHRVLPIECLLLFAPSVCLRSLRSRPLWDKDLSAGGLSGDSSGGASGEEPTCQFRRHKRLGFNPWVGEIPWRGAWQSPPVFLTGESHGQRSLVGYSPWVTKSGTQLKRLSMHTQFIQKWSQKDQWRRGKVAQEERVEAGQVEPRSHRDPWETMWEAVMFSHLRD